MDADMRHLPVSEDHAARLEDAGVLAFIRRPVIVVFAGEGAKGLTTVRHAIGEDETRRLTGAQLHGHGMPFGFAIF